jgi:hypothetical protein
MKSKEQTMLIVQADAAEQMNAEFQFDEASFLAKIPYKLTPTRLKGVYLNPTPPDNFDPRSASQMDLIKNGILIRKPTAQDPPEASKPGMSSSPRSYLPKTESCRSLKFTSASTTTSSFQPSNQPPIPAGLATPGLAQ